MDYTIKSNRVILTTNENTHVIWFKDIRKFILSGSAIYFETNLENLKIKPTDITSFNGWGVVPSMSIIYSQTKSNITIFEGDTNVSGAVTANIASLRVLSTRDPLPTDDVSKGYTVFTEWLNETTSPANLFQCSSNITGAAVWNWIQYINL